MPPPVQHPTARQRRGRVRAAAVAMAMVVAGSCAADESAPPASVVVTVDAGAAGMRAFTAAVVDADLRYFAAPAVLDVGLQRCAAVEHDGIDVVRTRIADEADGATADWFDQKGIDPSSWDAPTYVAESLVVLDLAMTHLCAAPTSPTAG